MTDTLKSICEQYTHLNNPQLDFIPDKRQREIILRDLKELVSAASAELEKTVVILAGSLLEAILYSFLHSQESFIAQRRGTFAFPAEAKLQNYVDIFNRWLSVLLPNVDLPNVVVDYRNLVHIENELAFPPDICERASRESLAVLNTLLGELSQFVNPQP
jgi:hypothetical protein